MSELPRVKVVNPGDGWCGTEYYINDQKIEKVKAVDFRVAVDEMPTFTFETMGAPDIEMPGDIWFSFTPQTIEKARKIIEHETKNKHHVDLELQNGHVDAYIDGERIPYCDSVNCNVDCGENIDSMEFVPNKNALLLYSDDIQADLSEYTRFAMIVLRNELLKNGDFYNGFLASVESAIKEIPEAKRIWDYELAEHILKRLIGEE